MSMNDELGTQDKILGTDSSLSTAAVFDVDRTLVPITTTERIFIRYLVRKRILGVRILMRTVFFVAGRMLHATPFEALRRERTYLAGLPYERIEHLAQLCFESDIKPRISKAGLESIQDHKRQGHMIVLLSGSLDFLLRPLKEYVEADHLIAANMEVVDGNLTGRIVGNYPYGNHKAAIIRHFAQEHNIDFSQSYAYADHHTDHEILMLFGNPIAVNPKRRMKRIAQREGWAIKKFA